MSISFEHSFGFLIGDLARLLRENFNQSARSLDLTLAQSRALIHLARNEGVNQSTLAALLEIQPITLVRQLDRLEENGLIERQPDPRDRRMLRLYLTPKARPLIDTLTSLGQAMTEMAFDKIDDIDRQQVISTLEAVKQNLSRMRESDSDEGEQNV